jgi:hypothetical protein
MEKGLTGHSTHTLVKFMERRKRGGVSVKGRKCG